MAKVLVVASLASSLVRFRGDLIRSIRGRGHEVLASAPSPDAQTIRRLEADGVAVSACQLSRAGLNPFADLTYLQQLRKLLRRFRPDVVLAYTPKPVVYSGIACRMESRPRSYALISGLGYAFGTESLKQRVIGLAARTLYRAALSQACRVIFQNQDDLDLFVSLSIISRSQGVLVSGSGVCLNTFAMQPHPESPVFLMMARLIPEKGVREYAEAARYVRARIPHARFLLAGWFEDRKGSLSRAEVERWQDEGVVEYLGALDDVRPALARCSIYVLPSYYREGLPRSVLEAMASGRAIITTDMPGCRETVRHQLNGLLVPPRDVTALTQAMEHLAGNRMLVAGMGAASRRMAEERFGLEQVNDSMLRAMELA